MNKNDRIIVIIGVVILVISSIGIFSFQQEPQGAQAATINDVIQISGNLSDVPDSIIVSDTSPFYPLIATPIAINYDTSGEQSIIPLYIMNLTEPSRSIERIRNTQLSSYTYNEYIIDDTLNPKIVSLYCAEHFWEHSTAALIMSMNQSGYELGLLATPIASYLSIPVIVTDEIDADVVHTLREIGVTHSIICGPYLSGYGKEIHLNSVDEIINATVTIIQDKFGTIDYISLTNPIDAWPPNVLDEEAYNFGPITIKSISMSKLPQAALAMITGSPIVGTFTIPEDYKYALIKFEGINHEIEDIDKFGDSVDFSVTSNSEDAPTQWVITGSTGTAGNPIRDTSGKVIKDRLVQEVILYAQGGVECTITAQGSWAILKSGEVSANVIIQKLDNPVYPLMKSLSTISPYLTAYHKGIIFGTPDFAFTADDDVITDKGETCPGFYVSRRNSPLTPLSNRHFFDNIHDPLNDLLAKLAGIDLNDERDIRVLQNHYKNNPVYIALVGDATVLPNYFYQNHVEPFGDVDGDGVDDTVYWVGGGTPSDVLYGNIDPIRYDWSNQANDIYTEYPFMENVVSRITGWDAQDASALVIRSLFYDEILEQYDQWKDNFGLLIGGGQDFQKPLVRQILFEKILRLVSPGEPMKVATGYGEQSLLRTKSEVAEPLGFNVQEALFEEAMRVGLSDESLNEIKEATLFNRFFFNKNMVRSLAGEGNVKGGAIYESSNFIFANGHGCQNFYGMGGNDLTAAGLFGPIVHKILIETIIPALGGFMGPGGDLSKVGDYTCREVSNMELGPSFMWLESCICGKIDGMYPKASSTQTHLHAGIASMISSSTGSNIGGGYLDPKNMKYDLPIITKIKYFKNKLIDWNNQEFDDAHFGFKVYGDLCEDLRKNDISIGLAFRNARNNYFTQEEIDWEVWWTPPLIRTGNYIIDKGISDVFSSSSSSSASKGPMMDSKYVTYQEYLLFGDPALNPYEPINEG
ncbi:MAG: C25 family cysteine peptidase [Thermoplasmatota archaeon]